MNNSKAKIIAVANQKGGVAKTTSVINIGAGLALKGEKVLLVDTDNQSHLSRFLGYDGTDGNWYSFKPADISRLKNYTGQRNITVRACKSG